MSQVLTETKWDFKELVESLITEDDEPVDNVFSAKHQRLLTETLYSSWKPLSDEEPRNEPRPFFADSNIGVFFSVHEPPLVPDVFISLDVTAPEDIFAKTGRSYMLWEYGKVPEVAVEIVSNKEGGELGNKLKTYARKGIHYYVVFDPLLLLSDDKLRVYEPGLLNHYRRRDDFRLPDIGLGLTLWQGEFEGVAAEWLRWTDGQGNLLLTGTERAEVLAKRLRELGVDPNKI
jgi:Uma2 family endonuclease